MSKIEIRVPIQLYPKKDPVNPCPCQFRPFQLENKSGTVTWLANVGEHVEKDQVICEGEVEKKALEFLAPCDGILCEICIADENKFTYDDVLGYIESEE